MEFKKESIVKKIMRKNPVIKIQDKVLILNFVGKESGSKGSETKDEKKTKGTFSKQTLKNETKIFLSIFNLIFFFRSSGHSKKHIICEQFALQCERNNPQNFL